MKRPSVILSYFRRLYQSRFTFRCAVLAATVALYFLAPGQFDVLPGFACFRRFSVFDLLWVIWMADMVMQLIPSRKFWPLGSQKFFKETFRPLKAYLEKTDRGLVAFILKSNRDTLRIGLVWFLLTAAIGAVYYLGWIDRNLLLVISVLFYVLDLVFVLFWCPFRVWFMKNRCCTTCRIFNWDHMMMFSPIVFIPGFYTWTLCLAALVVFVVWEVTFALHPERFWEGTNDALKCENCSDRLCGERNCRVDVPPLPRIRRAE
jgi:hypothetical protein